MFPKSKEVGRGKHTRVSKASDARSIDLRTDLRAAPEAVWKAISDGEWLSRWFSPTASAEPGAGGLVTPGRRRRPLPLFVGRRRNLGRRRRALRPALGLCGLGGIFRRRSPVRGAGRQRRPLEAGHLAVSLRRGPRQKGSDRRRLAGYRRSTVRRGRVTPGSSAHAASCRGRIALAVVVPKRYLANAPSVPVGPRARASSPLTSRAQRRRPRTGGVFRPRPIATLSTVFRRLRSASVA